MDLCFHEAGKDQRKKPWLPTTDSTWSLGACLLVETTEIAWWKVANSVGELCMCA